MLDSIAPEGVSFIPAEFVQPHDCVAMFGVQNCDTDILPNGHNARRPLHTHNKDIRENYCKHGATESMDKPSAESSQPNQSRHSIDNLSKLLC